MVTWDVPCCEPPSRLRDRVVSPRPPRSGPPARRRAAPAGRPEGAPVRSRSAGIAINPIIYDITIGPRLVCVNYSTRTRIVADRERFPRSWLVLTESEAHKLALLQVLFGVFEGCDV